MKVKPTLSDFSYQHSKGRYKTSTLESGLDYGLDFGLRWTLNSDLELLFKEDFECWIAQ